METTDLATTAVAILTATATGAAGAVGQNAGTAAIEALRARVGSTERGRAALETLRDAPEDPAAREAARSVVQEEIEADPELRHRLHVHMTAPVTHVRDTLLISGSRVSRSSISLGPLTVNNTRGGRALVSVVAALLVALVALVVYGGAGLILVDDSPDSSGGAGAGRAVRALNAGELRRVVPDLTSMPSGWERSGPVATGTDEEHGCSMAEARFVTADGRSSAGKLVHALFTVWSCPKAAVSAQGYEETVSAIAHNNEAAGLPLPELGDQRFAITHYNPDLDEATAHAVLRVGTVLIELEYDPVLSEDAEWNAEFEQMASTVATRAQEVQNA
ncbi:hypothetical protein AB0E77_22580 [Streptomyces sp. NPDC032940]|uniref:hypothetical protein n=1 Tax=Streptomyces sp. NPDC032940 TaxID=3155366 RepID=UPI0033D1343A